MSTRKCPVCGISDASENRASGYTDAYAVECRRCGRFVIRGTAKVKLEGFIVSRAISNSRLSHALRLRYDAQKKPTILSNDYLQAYQDDRSHVSPQQQLDNLILWVGNNQRAPQEWAKSDIHAFAARIGTEIGSDQSELGVAWLVKAFQNQGLFEWQRGDSEASFRLTPNGWLRFDELKIRVVNSRTAFMAMKFGDDILNRVLKECFQPAAGRAGFILKALDEQPSAGLIDNQIRAAIRTARFVIADLSHNNNGAYFEAGFAEGLGLPVIYTCEAEKFIRKETHFDTNHMHTVLWRQDGLVEASHALTATIRNTLPFDAKTAD